MNVLIDWLSFTLPLEEKDEPAIARQGDAIARRLIRELGEDYYMWIYDGSEWEYCVGRAPYRYGFRRADNGVTIYIGSNTLTMLVEITGRGCVPLATLDSAKLALELIANNLTRIDVACDMRCDERPADFANNRAKGKSLSLGFNKSATGETVYLGSMKSERFCRVYRYEDPHPRAPMLRFEAVYRRDYAKALAWTILDADTWAEVAETVGERYGWQSENWDTANAQALEMRLPRGHRGQDKTVIWLLNTCAPSLAKCIEAGSIDLETFLEVVEKRVHISNM